MTSKKINELKLQGNGADTIYDIAARNYGLFGVAFFGHKLADRKKHKIAKAKLNRVWKRILKSYPNEQN